MKRILIINPFGIGDVLFTTPVISTIRKNFPRSFIGYLCNCRAEGVLRNNPKLDKIFVYEKDDFRALWRKAKFQCIREFAGLLKRIRECRFDTVIDLSLGREYSFVCMLLGIRQRIGFNYKNRGLFLTKKLLLDSYSEKHIVEYYLDLMRLCGLEDAERRLEFFLSEEEESWADEFLKRSKENPEPRAPSPELLIGIVPGGGRSWGNDAVFKRWAPENFARVADGMSKRYKIVLMGAEDEKELCDDVAFRMKEEPVIACGKTDIGEFAALLKRCGLLICSDGGPLHIAVAVGTRTVSIFGPVDERVYGPYPKEGHIVITAKELECRPCYRRFKVKDCSNRRCLNEIDVEEVVEAAESLLMEG